MSRIPEFMLPCIMEHDVEFPSKSLPAFNSCDNSRRLDLSPGPTPFCVHWKPSKSIWPTRTYVLWPHRYTGLNTYLGKYSYCQKGPRVSKSVVEAPWSSTYTANVCFLWFPIRLVATPSSLGGRGLKARSEDYTYRPLFPVAYSILLVEPSI